MIKSCPNEEMLADYIEGRLSDNDRAEMEAHLSDCEMCLEGFMVGERLFRAGDQLELDAVPNRVTENAVRVVHSQISPAYGPVAERFKRSIKGLYASLLDLFRPVPWGRLALAPIRGSKIVVSDDLVHLRKTFKEIETEIEVEKTGTDKVHIRVRLAGSSRHKKGIRVTLEKGEREIYSHPINGGYVLFEDIPFGHYGLTFSKDGVKLGSYLFEIRESHHDRE